jgi:serine protease Do
MRTKKTFLRTLGLSVAAAVAGALFLWQMGPAPAVSASPSVDQKIQKVQVAPGAPASFADVIEAVEPAVVNISVSGTLAPEQAPYGGEMPPGVPFQDFQDFLRRFFERQSNVPGMPGPSGQQGRTFQGMASGFIVAPEGYVVTNQHVVDHATEVTVTLHDGKRLPAKIVGIDAKTDLALLKVDADEELPYARFGDSDKTRVGDWIVAIGNPFGLGGSATAGIVSARGRDIQSGPYDDFFQIDAPINRGNSGGPLFDLSGHVIGINTAIFSPNGGNVGIGFAIPSNLASKVIDDLRTDGRVDRGWLGVTIQPVDADIAKSLGLDSEKGALVASVVPDGPADHAGIRAGDVITKVDGKEIDQVKELSLKVAEIAPEHEVGIEVLRNGKTETLEVKLGRTPADSAAPRTDSHESAKGLGLTLGDLSPEMRQRFRIPDDVSGALIVNVAPQSGSAEKGLRPGDVIVGVGQASVANVDECIREVQRLEADGHESILLRVLRGGNATFVAVPLR